MYEGDRWRKILAVLREQKFASVDDICRLTGASPATVRRDISALAQQKRLRRVRGGAEPTELDFEPLAGRPFSVSETLYIAEKKAIARAAAALCEPGDAIIINGGTTTYQLAHTALPPGLQILTNSLPIAQHLLSSSDHRIVVPGGAIYREQNIILSPFENDVTANYSAKYMFTGAHGVGPLGPTEVDPLLIQAEQKLIGRADHLVVLADSSKFAKSSSLVLCPLERVGTLITDEGLTDHAAAMVESAGAKLIIVNAETESGHHSIAG